MSASAPKPSGATMPRVSNRGASDFQIRIDQLAQVPRANASELLKLAPGILLTNEGGEGHESFPGPPSGVDDVNGLNGLALTCGYAVHLIGWGASKG